MARRVRPGFEDDAERWITRHRRVVASAPGFGSSTVDPPSDAHPGEWLVVHSFETSAALDAWLTSAARRRLLDASDLMFQGDVREQRIADRSAGGDVTLVSSIRLRPGTEGDHRRPHDDGVRAATNVGGLVRAELLPAVDGVQPDTVALLTFASRGDLDRWLASPERADRCPDGATAD